MENKFKRKDAFSISDWERGCRAAFDLTDQNVFALAESYEDMFMFVNNWSLSGMWFLPDKMDLGIRSFYHLTPLLSQPFSFNSPVQPFEVGVILSHLQMRKLRYREDKELECVQLQCVRQLDREHRLSVP